MTLIIDGSHGEGGGQILRSSLALSMVTGTPFQIERIRAGRSKPGLMRQHLTALRAAMQICGATVEGDAIGSTQIAFTPGKTQGGEYTFSIGTAGSTTLVLQTVLLPLLLAKEKSRLTLEGGTHNPFAPPFDFLAKSYLPLVAKMGPEIRPVLSQAGFYPAGGGRFTLDIEPVGELKTIELLERGAIKSRRARALVANLPRHIAERELRVVKRRLNWNDDELEVVEVNGSPGPGNILSLEAEFENVADVFTGFGEPTRSAESVAEHAVQQFQQYMRSAAPVGEYLTDQLLLPLAIAGGGCFVSTGLSSHANTHIDLIRQFQMAEIAVERQGTGETLVRVG